MALKWAYKLGPITVNFRVLLEPKGFIRIIMMVIALLAFAITAGFGSAGNGNNISCVAGDDINKTERTATVHFSYPYNSGRFSIDLSPTDNLTVNSTACTGLHTFPYRTFSSSSQYFVAMGVLTMLYVIGAILVYMFFITPELYLAKWIVIGDFFLTITFGVFYILADIAWSAEVDQLSKFVSGRLRDAGTNCFMCNATAVNGGLVTQTYVQPAVSLIFGYLAAFIWFASIWFVYKDTTWHKDKTGPLASLYRATDNQPTDAQQASAAEQSGADSP